ncbi:MAG: WecB/TagA/CpsF family glycosyltransferase [Bacteroidota bacterium]
MLANYDYLLPDSQWIRRFINLFYSVRINKTITGTDLMLSVCDYASKQGYRIFLYGTSKPTLTKLVDKLQKVYPHLIICGIKSSLFRVLTYSEKKDLCSQIDKSDTDILFTALGSPLQELFTYEMLNRRPCLIKPVVAIPVGAAFDFISGVKPKAPAWMQKIGFEWLFRLMCEPRRLLKRYLIYGPLFIWFAGYEYSKSLLKKTD